MKLLEFNIDEKKLEIKRNFFGKECVFVDTKLVSKKIALFGTSHNVEIDGKKYELKYTIKDTWKNLTGKPTFQINSEGTLLSEHYIKNSSFLTIQFILGFIIIYCIYLIVMMIIESAKNGFTYNAY